MKFLDASMWLAVLWVAVTAGFGLVVHMWYSYKEHKSGLGCPWWLRYYDNFKIWVKSKSKKTDNWVDVPCPEDGYDESVTLTYEMPKSWEWTYKPKTGKQVRPSFSATEPFGVKNGPEWDQMPFVVKAKRYKKEAEMINNFIQDREAVLKKDDFWQQNNPVARDSVITKEESATKKTKIKSNKSKKKGIVNKKTKSNKKTKTKKK